MNNEDVNEHHWDAAMMRLVNEDGSWNDLRINKDNIGKVFLLKFKSVKVDVDPDASDYKRIAVLVDVTKNECVFDEMYFDPTTNHMKTRRHAITKHYRKTGTRIAFASILTDEPIYHFNGEDNNDE